MIKKYGSLEQAYKISKQKEYQTKKLNGSWNPIQSSAEKLLVKYLNINYIGNTIKYQIDSDSRYPYLCDAFILEKDLFVEVNFHPSHGQHPFDSTNQNDLELLEQLKNKNDDWSNMIIDVWSNRDVKKLDTVKQNKLNYMQIYPECTYIYDQGKLVNTINENILKEKTVNE